MDLHYLVSNKHWSADFSEVVPIRDRLQGELTLGVRFAAGDASKLRIRGGARAPHIRAGQDDTGWYARLVDAPSDALAKVRIALEGAGGGRVVRVHKIDSAQPAPLFLPSPFGLPDPFSAQDLVVEIVSPDADVNLLTSRRVERSSLLRLAKGKGIEIGPGPRPQIVDGEAVSVTYVEEKGAVDWLNTYSDKVSDAAWSAKKYIVGKAHDLPVSDHSLDFIFSSHVLEHLYNPLGHFEHWRTKLKPGALILGVVPSLEGTKDFVAPEHTISNLMAEQESGGFAVPKSAIERWVSAHNPHLQDASARVQKIIDSKFSIHVHVFDSGFMRALLQYSVDHMGFSDYILHFKKNSKDFTFALKA